jgi:anti-sigma regulatory factor (Ser/Thr protein kinase)
MMQLLQLNDPIIMEIPSDPAVLFLVRSLVERLGLRLNFTRQEVERMVLAVDEACTNVIRHAYQNRLHESIVLGFHVLSDRLEVRIRHYGTPVDPKTLQLRDLTEVRPGGLGIHFMQQGVDGVYYERPAEGGGLIRLVKQLPQASDD